MLCKFGSPLLSASATHSSEYPLPLKITLWCCVNNSFVISWASIATASTPPSTFSNLSHTSAKTSATIVFNTTFGSEIDCVEPTIRNSNLFPVNANGDVLLRSVASFSNAGNEWTPDANLSPCLDSVASPLVTSCFTTSSNWSPRKIEIIAGGASLAPNLWSFPGVEADIRSKSACLSTAAIIDAKISKNCWFSWGVFPGSNRFFPSFVTIDQLLCFPDPLIPANGFSWSKHFNPWRLATRLIVSINNWLWSVATLFEL